VQPSSEGRHSARHSRNPKDARPDWARVRPRNTTAAFYRWFAVFGLVALIGVVLAYRSNNPHANLTAANGGTVPLLGSSVLSTSDLAADTAAFGKMPIVRVYYPGLPSPTAWTSGLAGANHSAVIVSFKALPTTILSGADDAALRQFFDSAPTGHPIYYSYYHEPEDNIAAGQFGLADYKAAWARVVSIAKAAHNPDLHSTLILMSWDLVPASHRNWKDYLPGGGIISTLGWDAYPTGSATNQNPQLQPPSGFMGPAIAASKSVGLPYGFPEFGLSTADGRAGWLQTVGDYIMNSGALFAAYFNGNQQYPTLRLTDAASIAVWRSFVTASRNGGPAPGPSPSASPTPSPSPSGPPSSSVHVTGLTLTPSSVSLSTEASAALKFSLSQRANVTVCVLNSSGKIVRTVSRPATSAGEVRVTYLRYHLLNHRLPAGSYRVLVVASNTSGSAARSAALTITP
jgi:FlgD Ig-like domain